MNILDENVHAEARTRLRSWRIRVHQIGHDAGRKAIQDDEIIPLLLGFRRPTFFTRDRGFYQRALCHARYSVVVMEVHPEEVATFVRRLLRHPAFDTEATRLGAVIRLSHTGLTVWRLHEESEQRVDWPA